jgi:hypothetical protein
MLYRFRVSLASPLQCEGISARIKTSGRIACSDHYSNACRSVYAKLPKIGVGFVSCFSVV